jgi:molybdopterin converting factor small subunit
MGVLRGKLPPAAQGGKAVLDVEPGTSVASVLERLGVGGGHVHLVMVNGEQEREQTRALAEGDEVVVFPPVAGG